MAEKNDSFSENHLRDSLREALVSLSDRPSFLVRTMCERGIPIAVIFTEDDDYQLRRKIDEYFLLLMMSFRSDIEDFQVPVYRAVSFDRYRQILDTGTDVSPTDSVIWANESLEKALEYGGQDKVIMIFDSRKLLRSYKVVPVGASESEIEWVEAIYGKHRILIDNGDNFWYSRLPPDDRRLASPYECEHGWFILGSPFEALLGLILAFPTKTAPP